MLHKMTICMLTYGNLVAMQHENDTHNVMLLRWHHLFIKKIVSMKTKVQLSCFLTKN